MLGGLLLFAQISISVTAPDSVAACAPLEVTVELRAPGTEAPALGLPDFRPFGLVQSSARPRLESDSRRAMWVTDQYRYVLSTARWGTYVIPPFTARLGGEIVRSDPLRVTVVPPELTDGPEIVTRARIDHRRPVHFQALALPDTVFVGQQVTYQAAAFLEDSVQARLRRNPEFFPPEMRAMLAYELPFERGYLPRRGRATSCYEVPVFQRAIFPLMPGRHVIPPAHLVYTLPRSHSFFSREESHELRTDSVVVVAIEPPAAGRPADFTGAVGAFTLDARLDTSTARVGVPIVLTVRVSGTGNVKLLPRPEVSAPWAGLVAADERVDVSGVDRVGGTKEFDWVVTPHRAGRVTIPSLRYAYFDPVRERYDVAVSAPVGLSVAPGVIADVDTGAQAVPPMPVRREYRGAVARPVHSHAAFWLLLFAAPLPAFLAGAFRRPRRAPVPRTAAQRLRELARNPARADVRRVRRAFVAALSDRLAIPALAMTRRGALIRALRRSGVSTEVAADAEALLIALDAAAFSRDGRAGAPVRDAVDRACRIFAAVDREALHRPRPSHPGMRGVRTTALVLLGVLGAAAGLEARRAPDLAERHFAQGLEHYDARDYHSAVRAFGTAARLEPRAADAWANFGTSAWAVGDTVDAMVGWQRALRLEPMADEMRERLALMHAALPGEPDAVPPIPAWPLALAAAALWLLACGYGFAYAWRGTAGSVGLARIAALGALGIGGVAWHVDRRIAGDDLVVATAPTALRVLPALGAESSSGVAGADILYRLETRGAWVRVRTADAREGWLETARLVPLARD